MLLKFSLQIRRDKFGDFDNFKFWDLWW